MFTLAVASGDGMALSDPLAPSKFLCPEVDRLGPVCEVQPLHVAGLVVVGPVPLFDFASLDRIGDPVFLGIRDAPSHFQLSHLVHRCVTHCLFSLTQFSLLKQRSSGPPAHGSRSVTTTLATENAILAVPDPPDVSLTPDVPDLVDRCPQHADVPRVPTVGLPHSRGCLVGVAGSVCCDDFHVVSLCSFVVSYTSNSLAGSESYNYLIRFGNFSRNTLPPASLKSFSQSLPVVLGQCLASALDRCHVIAIHTKPLVLVGWSP